MKNTRSLNYIAVFSYFIISSIATTAWSQEINEYPGYSNSKRMMALNTALEKARESVWVKCMKESGYTYIPAETIVFGPNTSYTREEIDELTTVPLTYRQRIADQD